MKQFTVTVKGKSPYMQHRMDTESLDLWEKKHNLTITRPEVSQEDSVRAEYHCYRNQKGKCYIPAEHFRQAMIGAGTFIKSKVGASTKSMKGIVAAMFTVSPEEILLPDYDGIDKRSAVNRVVKARIITVRPKWSNWKVTFKLLIDNDTITKEIVQQLLTFAGSNVGIGSYRPTNNGQFGRFEVVDLKEL